MIPRDLLEQAAGYALGALSPDERSEFEAAMAGSAQLRGEVAELRQAAAWLAVAPPLVAPPPRLRDRIIAEARSVRPIATGRRESAAQEHKEERGPASTPIQFNKFVPWLALAASLAGILVMRNRAAQEARRGDALVAANGDLQAQLMSRDSVINALLAPDVETVKLAATGQPPSARLFWNRTSQQVVFVAFAVPQAAAGRTYQLWGIAKGKNPVSLGTFNTDARGEARLTAGVPIGLEIAVGAVTEEPAGGSVQPTTTPFLVGEFK